MADPVRFPQLPRPVRQLMGPLAVSARGMGVQQRFLEIVAANLANAETTRTPEGGPYRRQVAVAGGATEGAAGEIVSDPRPGRLVYDPGHPDANADGYVQMPNVNVETELVDLMLARRLHEANVTAFEAAKHMLRRALDI